VKNDAKTPIEVFWVDTSVSADSESAYASMGDPIDDGEELGLNSYSGHQFLVRLSPHVEGVEATFKKGKNAEDFTVTYDAKHKALSAKVVKTLANIKSKVKALQDRAKRVASGPVQQPRQINATMDVVQNMKEAAAFCQHLRGTEFTTCMASNIIEDITKLTEAKTQLNNIRNNMSWRLRNYTCADDNIQTSPPVFTYNIDLANKKDVRVDVLLNKTHSKVWKVDNFITDAECDVLMKHGKPLLRRATVAAEDGSSIVSENRKANQAAYNMHKQNPETDPLW
jgi:hypothetical protein